MSGISKLEEDENINKVGILREKIDEEDGQHKYLKRRSTLTWS